MKRSLEKIKIIRMIYWSMIKKESRDFLLKAMPKESICAEIGVYRGQFSRRILDIVRPKEFHLIDPWKFEADSIYKDSLYGSLYSSLTNMNEVYDIAVNRLKREILLKKVIVHRLQSYEACKEFPDNYFDWIYIDGNHLYEFVKNDLINYYPKVKNNGFITGDDYTDAGWWRGGVKKAVDEFVAEGAIKLIEISNEQFILQK